MSERQQPEKFRRLAPGELFSFACHSGLDCFTHCCRQLDLTLTPYDVLRLKKGLGLTSSEFLDRYVIIEQLENDIFPQLFLTMVDDGFVSCVFVDKKGCKVYQDRPSACRTYPMGRAIMRKRTKGTTVFHILIEESHCHGFSEKTLQSPEQYTIDQGLDQYNVANDKLIGITQHDKIRQGMHLSPDQVEEYILALYNLDTFREQLFAGMLTDTPMLSEQEKDELSQDEALLDFAIEWIEKRLFGTPQADAL